MFIVPISKRRALQWHRFELNDVELLAASTDEMRAGVAAWIASVNSPREVKEMLIEIGRVAEVCAITGYPFIGIVFRTQRAVVRNWAERFHAVGEYRAGHNPRYLLRNPQFVMIAAKALQHSRRFIGRN